MKRILFQTLTLATVLAGSGAFSSVSASEKLTVDVPFSFVVGNKEFTPGHYRVEENNDGVILVQGEGRGAAILSSPAEMTSTGVTGLRFTSSQSHAYLTGMQVEGQGNRAIPMKTLVDRNLTISSR